MDGSEHSILEPGQIEGTINVIPNIIHFIFGLAPDFGGKPFSLVHYLAVKSAHDINQPDVINFYYKYMPQGEWWEQARPYLNLIQVNPPNEVFGRPLLHFAHQACVLRLQILIEHGGIYLDMDVLCRKPFTPLRNYDFVLGQEGSWGLCNAVILSEKEAAFAKKWLEGYDPQRSLWEGFRSKGFDEFWGEYAVLYPKHLGEIYSESIHIVGERGFHWPLHNNLEEFHRGIGKTYEETYCHHLWETVAWEPYLKELTVEYISTVDSNFNRIGRQILDLPDIKRLRYDLGGIGHHPEYMTVNMIPGCDYVHDIRDLDGFIEEDGVVEEFLLSHTLEHIATHEYRQFLLDMKRKLKVGGRIKVILSDAEQVIGLWQQGRLSFRAMRMVLFPPADRMALNPLNQHYNMWTAEELLPDFSALGFEAHTFDAGAWSYDLVDELYPEETKQYWGTPIMNLGVVAVKRE